MNERQKDYLVKAGVVLLVLVLGFFGIKLPATPDMPAPLIVGDPALDGPMNVGERRRDPGRVRRDDGRAARRNGQHG